MLLMRKLMVYGAAAVLAASFNATAADKPAPPKVAAASVVTMTATVQDIDVASRFVTLKDADGKLRTVQVGEQVKNLPQVKVGDIVVARYVQAVALELKKGGSGVRSVTEKEGMATAKPGEKPAGVAAEQTTVVATVEKVDAKKRLVTVKGPRGNTVDVEVKDPKKLKQVKVGDEVEITYTEALALSVESPKK